MAKPTRWDGPQFGTVRLTLTFPIRDGGDARDAQDVAERMLGATFAGVLPPETTLIDEIETSSRSRDAEAQRRKRRGCTVPLPPIPEVTRG